MNIPNDIAVEFIIMKMHDLAAGQGKKSIPFEKRITLDEVCDALHEKRDEIESGMQCDCHISKTVSFDVSITKHSVESPDYQRKYGDVLFRRAIEEVIASKVKREISENRPIEDDPSKIVKIIILSSFLLMTLFCRAGTDYYETVDGVKWCYSTDNVDVYNNGIRPCSEVKGKVVVPSKIKGWGVTEIAGYAFYEMVGLEEIILPGTIKNIDVRAFSGCTDLKKIVMNGVTNIANEAFFNTPNLKELVFPRGLQKIGLGAFSRYSKDVPSGLFYSGTGLEKITIFEMGFEFVLNTPPGIYPCRYISPPLTGVNVFISEANYGTMTTNSYGGKIIVGWATPVIYPTSGVFQKSNIITIDSGSTNALAKVYYTLDGTDPTNMVTDSCFEYVDGIAISKRTTVKAATYVNPDSPYVDVISKEIGFGQTESPKINSSMEYVFHKSNNIITLDCGTIDATVRYTLDGLPVTEQSPIYTKPFAISETTTVRAKAFKLDWFDSEEVVQTFTRIWHTNETLVVTANADSFATVSQEVTLSCGTDGATIYYTLDGSEPSAANGRVYKGPFNIYQTTTVKAIAVKDDWKDSAIASATFTKENVFSPAINLLEVLPDNDKTHPWSVVTDVTHDGVSAMKSGAISDEESTTMKVVLYGAGRLSFWWKTSCEPGIDGELYDFATFYNGSTAVTNLAGVTDWQKVSLEVPGTGKHTFKWTYQKDDSGSTVPDGVWLDQVQWLPQTSDYYSDHTLTTEIPVPYAWLDWFGLGHESDFETAAKSKSGKHDGTGRELTVEEEFMAGTDPTNMNSLFSATIEIVDGLPRVKWTPDLNEGGTKNLRTYTVWGKESLDDPEWTFPTNNLHRFFKVSVGMP